MGILIGSLLVCLVLFQTVFGNVKSVGNVTDGNVTKEDSLGKALSELARTFGEALLNSIAELPPETLANATLSEPHS